MAPARRSLVQEEPTARWVSFDGAGSSRRPEPLPAFEIWLTEQREQQRVFFERAWRRRRQRRYRRAVRRHHTEVTAWRHDEPGGPERWKFVCSEAERIVSAAEYRAVLAAQAAAPCLLLETLEGTRWWMYGDRFYVSDAELGPDDVAAALTGGRAEPPAVNGCASGATRPQQPRPERAPPPAAAVNGTPRDVPPDVRRYVVARDRGRCAACGDDGPDLQVDPATLRLICADCLADGWIPAARAVPASAAEPAVEAEGEVDPAAAPPGRANGSRPPRPPSVLGARPSAPRSRRRRRR